MGYLGDVVYHVIFPVSGWAAGCTAVTKHGRHDYNSKLLHHAYYNGNMILYASVCVACKQ